MNCIKVNAFLVNESKEKEYFGDETGTPQFYMVSDTLKKHLGEENVWISWDYIDFCFFIEEKDNTINYIKIIEKIYEPFEPNNFIIFEII